MWRGARERRFKNDSILKDKKNLGRWWRLAHRWRFGRRAPLLSKAETGFGASKKVGLRRDVALGEPDLSDESKMLQPCSSPGSERAANGRLSAAKSHRTPMRTGLSLICRTCAGDQRCIERAFEKCCIAYTGR
jgi:hypothetical protein